MFFLFWPSRQSDTLPSTYTAKNAQPVTMLMKTGLNNILLPILFLVVNNIVQHCSA
jgi:hypothetical protein